MRLLLFQYHQSRQGLVKVAATAGFLYSHHSPPHSGFPVYWVRQDLDVVRGCPTANHVALCLGQLQRQLSLQVQRLSGRCESLFRRTQNSGVGLLFRRQCLDDSKPVTYICVWQHERSDVKLVSAFPNTLYWPAPDFKREMCVTEYLKTETAAYAARMAVGSKEVLPSAA